MTLRDIRVALGQKQIEMVELLGISLRALQSYERGWRRAPCCVEKLAYLLLYLRWRGEHGNGTPCWEIMECDPARRSNCLAYQYGAGEFCWLVTGNDWGSRRLSDWQAKKAKCEECPVMKRWLGQTTAS